VEQLIASGVPEDAASVRGAVGYAYAGWSQLLELG